jgi:hypothetical protein
MMQRALRICRKAGCPTLVQSGYCPKHARIPQENIRESFEKLDSRKTPEQRAFYSSARWTEMSLRHRVHEPLCRACKARGIITPGTLTHHNPDRETLIARGLDPFDDQYLETLCDRCHMDELRKKKCQTR